IRRQLPPAAVGSFRVSKARQLSEDRLVLRICRRCGPYRSHSGIRRPPPSRAKLQPNEGSASVSSHTPQSLELDSVRKSYIANSGQARTSFLDRLVPAARPFQTPPSS